MIINKQILLLVGACEESVSHFIEVLGNGDENFQMSLDDAINYLIDLQKTNSDYENWAEFVSALKNNPEYIKASFQYSYGKYVIIGIDAIEFDDAISAKEYLISTENERFMNYLSEHNVQRKVMRLDNTDSGEVLVETDSAKDGSKYVVYNPLTGNNNIYINFDDAKNEIETIINVFRSRMCKFDIGLQIILDGKVVAVDKIENI